MTKAVRHCALVIGLHVSAVAAQSPNKPTAFLAGLDSVRQLLAVPGMSVALVTGDSVRTFALGLADVKARVPVTHGTRFPIASITKTMVSVMLMQLVDEQRLTLADPVPGSVSGARIEHVLSHTSDLGPGAEFLYNGTRFNTLGPILERAAGEPLGRMLQTRIFVPAHMTHALALARGDTIIADLAKPYDFDTATGKARGGVPADLSIHAASGVLATAEDLGNYLVALDRNVLLGADRTREMTTPRRSPTGRVLPYALGWFAQQYGGEEIRWHFGQESSYSSLLIWLPRQHAGLVVLANSAAPSDAARLLEGNIARSLIAQTYFHTVAKVRGPAGDVDLARAFAEAYVGHRGRADSLLRVAVLTPTPAISIDPSLLFLLSRIDDRALDGAARSLVAQITREHPTLPTALYFGALTMLHMADTTRAIALLGQLAALTNAPRHWSVVLGLTELGGLLAPTDPARAREMLRRVIDMNWNFAGSVDQARRVLAHLPPDDVNRTNHDLE